MNNCHTLFQPIQKHRNKYRQMFRAGEKQEKE